jgi:DNA-binding MarR family transcriptional regulator
MEQMDKHEAQTIGSSTLNYNLRILEENGFIERQKRHLRDRATGQIIFRPSMYKITSKLRRFFNKLADKFQRCGWTPMFRRLKNHFNPPVVGKCTSQEEVLQELRAQSLARQKQKQKGTAS